MPTSSSTLAALYEKPLPSTRTGALFNAFPYPTKISPETIALYIAAHTAPGDSVFDGFGGSGSTGIAAALCSRPTDSLRKRASSLRLQAQWGPRRALLYELSVLGALVGKTLANPPDPLRFREAALGLVSDVEARLGWLYEAVDPSGTPGCIRHVVWSDAVECPKCHKQHDLWDACVSREPAKIRATFRCSSCGNLASLDEAPRVRATVSDDLLGGTRSTRLRKPAWVYGDSGGKKWSRAANGCDLAALRRIDSESLPACVPITPIPWGDLHRSGYHEGITHLHHFYTRRNLIALGTLWEAVTDQPETLHAPLRMWLLSYNAAHCTLMTRVVAKTKQKDLVVTSGQPGVLYISGLPVEKNVFAGVRRKLNTLCRAFDATSGSESQVEVVNASCLDVDAPDESIDYVFTDPPFGGNIPYAEVNFINEAWLGTVTNRADEVIVSKHQDKDIATYQSLLHAAFAEICRLLKPSGHATVVFHSSAAAVWNALRSAYEDAGLAAEKASILNKTQGSFKQVTTSGAVRGDPVLLLSKACKRSTSPSQDVWDVTESLIKELKQSTSDDSNAQRVYSRLVGHYLSLHQDVPINAGEFYRLFRERVSSH